MRTPTDNNKMVHMRLNQLLLKRLEDFRFRHRFASRSAAARWLMKAALEAKLTPKKGE
jgi:metal-responsive CopG/Arc/MetJ family transcriptional regulator